MAVASPAPRAWSDLAAVALIVLVVSTMYGFRLTDQTVIGEEPRWATGAREMLATGDWIVPRQQGQVFPERPPMSMWLMAAVGYVRGDVDSFAIRLPSVVAVVLTSLMIYGYTRALVSGFAALVAALAYASMGQVLQIGRMGESEAMFTLLVGASLLVWHLGYMRRWPPLASWSVGFGCAALAALTKGPQAPVYFVAITAAYLVYHREWRYLFCWEYAVGAALFALVVAAWQIPFYRATNFDAVIATWAGLAADRVQLTGLMKHVVAYPLETFVCLLPWSPLLVALAKRETRDLLADRWELTSFQLIALAIAYPTVWLVSGAQARYFMPLYPLVAVLVGLVVERCSTASVGSYPRRAWHQFLLFSSVLVSMLAGLALLRFKWALGIYEPPWLSGVVAIVAAAVVAMLWTCYRRNTSGTRIIAAIAIAGFAAVTHVGVLMNVNTARWNDPTATVAQVKNIVGRAPLVSLTPIDHRFVYFYGRPIRELPWPEEFNDLPEDVEYFCFMRDPKDTALSRESGRGRSWTTTSGMLPFAWEEVATLCVERRIRNQPQPMVVLGRVLKPRQAMVTDATTPRPTSINLTAVVNRAGVTR